MTEVVWPVDRLAKELAGVRNEVTRLENQMRMMGSMRTVGDVDVALEKLEVRYFGGNQPPSPFMHQALPHITDLSSYCQTSAL